MTPEARMIPNPCTVLPRYWEAWRWQKYILMATMFAFVILSRGVANFACSGLWETVGNRTANIHHVRSRIGYADVISMLRYRCFSSMMTGNAIMFEKAIVNPGAFDEGPQHVMDKAGVSGVRFGV